MGEGREREREGGWVREERERKGGRVGEGNEEVERKV